MSVFVIVATRDPGKILEEIRQRELAHFKVTADSWLVAAGGTTRELAESLGIRSGENGSGLVCRIEGYSGRLAKDAWEWLSIHEARSE
jgi:hypothetical protein